MHRGNAAVNRNRLLIVDDEPAARELFADVADELGYATAEAGNEREFLEAFEGFDPTAILLDLTLPETDGVELLRALGDRKCASPILLVSGQDTRVLSTAQRLGNMFGLTMRGVLQKPVSLPDLETSLSEMLSTGADVSADQLAAAIDHNELVIHFQPKIDLQQGDRFPVVGGEALVRWHHPERGLVPPGEFIPLAEESGLIGSLTEVVVRDTIRQLVEWRGAGLAVPIAVNLSPIQLTDLALPDRLIGMLSAADLDPSLITVEITEQAAMSDVGMATDILTRLRLKNIAVSLDDFGAGYSSLVEIYRMPLSELKLDRSLIVDLDKDLDAKTVVKAIVALARELRLPVCAEGIETEQTARFLQSIGCEKAQGFHFAKPSPAADFAAFVRGRNGAADNGVVPARALA